MDWRIVLDVPPTIHQIGIGVHGTEPVERYRLDDLWCVHLYRYDAEVRLNGVSHTIAPGHVSVTAPGVELEYRFRGPAIHAYAHFALPMPGVAGIGIPAMQPLGPAFVGLNRAFEEAIGWFPGRPRRAEARLWDILWQLAGSAQPTEAAMPVRPHPAVVQATALIELRLAEPISVAALAAEVSLSHNHLTRLFRAHTGATVAGYIAQRRLQRAQHLLKHTTLPVKAIAAQVGMADLHLFNKTVRRALGASPRRLRA